MKYELYVFNKQQVIEEKVWTFFFTEQQVANYTFENGYAKDLLGNYIKDTDYSTMILCRLEQEGI